MYYPSTIDVNIVFHWQIDSDLSVSSLIIVTCNLMRDVMAKIFVKSCFPAIFAGGVFFSKGVFKMLLKPISFTYL